MAGRTISPATVNKDLRYIKAALRTAYDWELIDRVPRVRFLKQPQKLPTFVTQEHFVAIYRACDTAKLPGDIPNVDPTDWWRGLLVMLYLTGWRIGQVLALKWDDVDIEGGTALSRAEDNKGKRDAAIPLRPEIVSHLQKLAGSFGSHVFPWNHHERTLWVQFDKIQQSATVAGEDGELKAMPKCGKEGWYGFHDLRRGFATENAENLDPFKLQQLMQHKSLETTRGYINMVSRLRQTVDGLFVPDVLRETETA